MIRHARQPHGFGQGVPERVRREPWGSWNASRPDGLVELGVNAVRCPPRHIEAGENLWAFSSPLQGLCGGPQARHLSTAPVGHFFHFSIFKISEGRFDSLVRGGVGHPRGYPIPASDRGPCPIWPDDKRIQYPLFGT